jgi:hypothetical protein
MLSRSPRSCRRRRSVRRARSRRLRIAVSASPEPRRHRPAPDKPAGRQFLAPRGVVAAIRQAIRQAAGQQTDRAPCRANTRRDRRHGAPRTAQDSRTPASLRARQSLSLRLGVACLRQQFRDPGPAASAGSAPPGMDGAMRDTIARRAYVTAPHTWRKSCSRPVIDSACGRVRSIGCLRRTITKAAGRRRSPPSAGARYRRSAREDLPPVAEVTQHGVGIHAALR